jgi:hypothetical protein
MLNAGIKANAGILEFRMLGLKANAPPIGGISAALQEDKKNGR